MRKLILLVAVVVSTAGVVAVGCGDATYIALEVSKSDPQLMAVQLKVTLTNIAGTTDTLVFPETAAGALVFPATVVITLPAAQDTLSITVVAVGPGGKELSSTTTTLTANVTAGAGTNVGVTLSSSLAPVNLYEACTSGSQCISGPGQDVECTTLESKSVDGQFCQLIGCTVGMDDICMTPGSGAAKCTQFTVPPPGPNPPPRCTKTCTSSADCGPSTGCNSQGICVSTCATDGDCAPVVCDPVLHICASP